MALLSPPPPTMNLTFSRKFLCPFVPWVLFDHSFYIDSFVLCEKNADGEKSMSLTKNSKNEEIMPIWVEGGVKAVPLRKEKKKN